MEGALWVHLRITLTKTPTSDWVPGSSRLVDPVSTLEASCEIADYGDACGGGGRWCSPYPKNSKVPNYTALRVSILGTVMMVLGRYPLFGYVDP